MTTPENKVRIWGVIPAAGLSRRMGRPKQLLPYRNSTFVGTVTRILLEAGVDGVVVVTQSQFIDDLDLPEDERVHLVINDQANTEMIDSIRIALTEIARLDTGNSDLPPLTEGVLVIPGDMPSICADTCRRCMEKYIADPQRIVIATYAGRRGHPMIFPLTLRAAAEKLKEGLRDLQGIFPERILEVEVDDPSLVQDIDTLEDYERL